MVIYKIENKINGKIYIGLTKKQLSRRIASHIGNPASHLGKALRKYGIESFSIGVIDHADSFDMRREIWPAKVANFPRKPG